MKFRFTIVAVLLLALVLASGCSDSDPEPGVKICSVAVGAIDVDGKFASAEKIPFRVGTKYGYELSVHSTSGQVKVKEVLDLPQPAMWDENEAAEPGVKFLGAETLNDGKTHIVIYELETGDKMIVYSRGYSIAESDPKGRYQFTIYLDDQLLATEELMVE
jgi:hypothetical protein